MTRGRLRVLLGAAPGVGKTYAMLEAGRDLRAGGTDVVVAVVETHGRAATAGLLEGFEVVPRARVVHRGVVLTEMDLDAVLARRPRVALVDEYAHTNAPGARNDKRWQDVAVLLDAGIDVLTTVNIQHIESLNDVVRTITGVPQRETVPDRVLRSADQIELVDLTPQSLRDRLAAGDVYPAERVDAALSHYFRLGNLTALRELALLWLADEVDSALRRYRAEHAIDSPWEARERVVVALTGGPEGETLLRRGARIAARSAGGELLAVHVTEQTGLRDSDPEALAGQAALVEQLGGSYHQVLGEDVPAALVEFARSRDATQLVIGLSRRSRLRAALSGPGIGSTVIRESGPIDVHIVNHDAAATRRPLPRITGALTVRRRVLGFALSLVLGPLLTAWLVAGRSEESLAGDVLAYQLLVVVVALVGGLWPALLSALLSGLTLNYLFVAPLHTVSVNDPVHALALVLYVANALLVSAVVDVAARRSRAAQRARAESELLATVAGGVLRGQDALAALIERTQEAFGLAGVRLRAGEDVLAESGTVRPGSPSVRVDEHTVLELDRGGAAGVGAGGAGAADAAAADAADAADAASASASAPAPAPAPADVGDAAAGNIDGVGNRLLGVVVTQVAAVLERQRLSRTADAIGPLQETDQVRSALLSAVSHDLRRPLTAATTAVGSLRSADVDLTPEDRDELLATADESLTTLTGLVTDLLDVSRLQAGVLGVSCRPTDVDDVVLPALDELGLGPDDVHLELDPDLPAVQADPALLRRVLVNVLANAVRASPAGVPARVRTSAFADRVEIRVVDQGPGVPADRKPDLFVPFQRLGDTDNATGLGLGLALSRGFAEGMGGTLAPEDTPGGGLTMVIALRQAGAGSATSATGVSSAGEVTS
jgi:two-component system sensor histidine kinase KdpD